MPKAPGRRDLNLVPQTDAQVVASSDVTPADVLAAQATWRRRAPAAYKGLLDATERDADGA